MKITATQKNGTVKIETRVKVNVYSGVYMYPDGSVGSSLYYETTNTTKADLIERFQSDCVGNDVKPVKFMKIGVENRVYKRMYLTCEMTSGEYEVEE